MVHAIGVLFLIGLLGDLFDLVGDSIHVSEKGAEVLFWLFCAGVLALIGLVKPVLAMTVAGCLLAAWLYRVLFLRNK